jgi:hypothetical protein
MTRTGTETSLLSALKPSDTGADVEIPLEGSKALYLAVLKEAIQCLHGLEADDAEERQLAWRAKRWIEADDWDDTFSFDSVCGVLGLDPGSVRSRLLAAVSENKLKLSYSVGRRTKVRVRRASSSTRFVSRPRA